MPLENYEEAFAPKVHDFAEPAITHFAKPRAMQVEDPADPDHAVQRQQAFDSTFVWHGKELLPFTSSRDALFSQQRLAMGAPALDACLGDLDAFAGDAHRILWLCSHTPKDWSILRTSPPALQNAIDSWADEHVSPREHLQACKLAIAILEAARINEHEAAPAKAAHGDDLGN